MPVVRWGITGLAMTTPDRTLAVNLDSKFTRGVSISSAKSTKN
jgi:hypothetical protein